MSLLLLFQRPPPQNASLTQNFSANLTFTGTLTKLTKRRLSAVLSFAGALLGGRIFHKVFTAVLSFNGAFKKRIGKVLVGTVSFATKLPRFIKIGLQSSLSFTGVLLGWIVPFFAPLTAIVGSSSQKGTSNEDIANKTIDTGATIEGMNTPETKGNLKEFGDGN